MAQLLIKVLLVGGAGIALTGAALSISPLYHQFGNVGVMGLKTFPRNPFSGFPTRNNFDLQDSRSG